MSVDDPHGFGRRLDKLLSEDIPTLVRSKDKRLLREYIKLLRKSQSDGTVYTNANHVRNIMMRLDVSFTDATEDQICNVIDDISIEKDWTDGSQRNAEKAARAVIKKTVEQSKRDWDFTADPEYITITKDDSGGKITEDDVFDREQVRLMVEEVARNERDRVMFGLLLDLGLRIAGVCSLRVDDYSYDEEQGIGKLQLNPRATGTKGAEDRVQVVTWSTPYIQRYLRGDHPRPDDKGAPLLHKTKGWKNDPEDDGSMSPPVFRRRLRRITADYDEIPDDMVNPHAFRHTAVTLWAKRGMSDREIEHRAGWARESGQLDRYEHLSDDDVNDDILRSHGIEPESRAIPELDFCPQCAVQIEPVMTYCANCGQRLDIVREKPQWFQDLRENLGDDDSLVEYFLENQHQLKESVEDLPQRLYSRLQMRGKMHMGESDEATIGESFIDARQPVSKIEEELEEKMDGFSSNRPDPDELDESVIIDIEDGPEIEVPASQIVDIWDEVARVERITETELVAYDNDGSAIKVISVLDEAGGDD